MMLTEYEKQLLKASESAEREYGVDPGDSVWVDVVIDASGFKPSFARGVLASLVKKGLCTVSNYSNQETIVSLTKEGIEIRNTL